MEGRANDIRQSGDLPKDEANANRQGPRVYLVARFQLTDRIVQVVLNGAPAVTDQRPGFTRSLPKTDPHEAFFFASCQLRVLAADAGLLPSGIGCLTRGLIGT